MLDHGEIGAIMDYLNVLPNKLAELEVALTRQTHFGSAYSDGGKNSGEKPLYFDEAATNARNGIRIWMVKYRAKIRHDWPVPYRVPIDRGTAMTFVLANAYQLRPYDSALEELGAAIDEVDRVIDIPRGRIYLGDCDSCDTKLYGDPEADELECPRCAMVYDPGVLRDLNQRRGESMLVTGPEARRYIGEVLGIPLTSSRMKNWTRRGYLTAVTSAKGVESVYRLGDVIECVRQRAKESGDRSVRT